MKRITTYVAVLLLPLFLSAQEIGKISGKVTDAATGAPLAGANVLVEGTSLGSSTDGNGNYSILNVPVGSHSIRAEFIGYGTVRLSGVRVSAGLTSEGDIALSTQAVGGATVDVVAERPIINKNATNTTRIVDGDALRNMPIRGVGAAVAIQAGAIVRGNNIHVRGGRTGDVAYYVDGVSVNNPFDMLNATIVSNQSVEEIQFQAGGFGAEYSNANGGLVNTSTRTGSDKLRINGEFLTDSFLSSEGTVDPGLYSYGYNMFNLGIGGPLTSKIRFYGSIESETTDDTRPTFKPYTSVTAVDGFDGSDENAIHDTIRWIYTETKFDSSIVAGDVDTNITTYKDHELLYGAKPFSGHKRLVATGNLLLDLSPLRIKVGGYYSTNDNRYYTVTTDVNRRAALNAEYNPRQLTTTSTAYANFTFSLSPTTFVKLNASVFNTSRERGDAELMDDVEAYGAFNGVRGGDSTRYEQGTGRTYNHREIGRNPLTISPLAGIYQNGTLFTQYHFSETSDINLRGDFVSQMGNHEVKAGFESRISKFGLYEVNNPLEIAQNIDKAEADTSVDRFEEEWIFTSYRNAYTYNVGYDIEGNEETEESSVYFAPRPKIFGFYVQDKIELEDLVLNFGIRFDSFDPDAEAPMDADGNQDWDNLVLTNGHIDRELSLFEKVKTHTAINPRVGMSFPVTDRSKFHAQYGKYWQTPMFRRLYLSDTRLSSNLTQGNFTRSPNPALKPERTTQYEIGFTQQIGSVAAVDITGFYKEIRDYTLLTNRFQAVPVFAQYDNGDFGVVKGMSLGLTSRRLNGLMVNANYTISWAEGTGSNPASNSNISWIGNDGDYPSTISALDFDQRHTGTFMLDYLAAGGFNINALYQFGSGTAYTPAEVESFIFGRGWNRPVSQINAGDLPWTATLDMRASKSLGNAISVYLWVTNALNTENVRFVYTGTGSADEDGWLNTPPGKAYSESNPERVDYYNDRIDDPANYESPRQVKLGITFNL